LGVPISSPGNSSLEKLRGAINHSHFIMKHIIGGIKNTIPPYSIPGGMDATKEFIFKAFMCFRCTLKALGVILWHFKVVQMNQG
jgi:hypothetical protein